jgi:MoaA/NifB/PqqE/SkfB family radical SAM enzyme
MTSINNIGFYTLSSYRCHNSDEFTPIVRAEIVLTDACNFKCPYCRGQREDLKHNMSFDDAVRAVTALSNERTKNLRFSGGEPTIWKGLPDLVRYAKRCGIERVAVSSNGSASLELYQELIDAGVDDFSISLDACCAAFGDKMAGVSGQFETVCNAIRYLSARVYTTVGIVVTDETAHQLGETVQFAANLGAHDIRVIPAAQWQATVDGMNSIPKELIARFPILRYRFENMANGLGVRGITESDSNRCGIVIDDCAIAGENHFPCIIYLREHGDPIGKVGPNMRTERAEWSRNHDTKSDPICRANCLDCIVQYNREYADHRRHLKVVR